MNTRRSAYGLLHATDVDVRQALAGALRCLPPRRHHRLHLRRAGERVAERVVDVLAQQAHGDVVALRNERGELEARQIEEEHVHRGAQGLADDVLAKAVLPDQRLRDRRAPVADVELLEQLQGRRVHADGHGHQVVAAGLAAATLIKGRPSSRPTSSTRAGTCFAPRASACSSR